jgi:hypothetical protein
MIHEGPKNHARNSISSILNASLKIDLKSQKKIFLTAKPNAVDIKNSWSFKTRGILKKKKNFNLKKKKFFFPHQVHNVDGTTAKDKLMKTTEGMGFQFVHPKII